MAGILNKLLFLLFDVYIFITFVYPLWFTPILLVVFVIPICLVLSYQFTSESGRASWETFKQKRGMGIIRGLGIMVALLLNVSTSNNWEIPFLIELNYILLGMTSILYVTLLFLDLVNLFQRKDN